MSEYQIIYWRDIPTQVRVRVGRQRLSQPLGERFQEAAKRAAYRAKAITGDAYMSAWNTTHWQACDGEPEDALNRVMGEIEASYPPERLLALIMNQGYRESESDDS